MVSLLRNSLTHSLTPSSLTCSSSSPRLGHKAPNQILPVHPVLSSQAVLHPMLDPTPPAPLSLFSARWFFCRPLFIFPVGVHLKTTSGILSLGILRTWPNYRSLRLLISRDIRIYTVCLLLQFIISETVMPINITDLTEAAVMEDVDLTHIYFSYFSALRAIQKDSLNIGVVKPDLSFEAVLLRPPDVAESTESTSGFVKASLWKQPFLLASYRWGRFAKRNVCDSATEIPYRCRKISPGSGQKRLLVQGV